MNIQGRYSKDCEETHGTEAIRKQGPRSRVSLERPDCPQFGLECVQVLELAVELALPRPAMS